MTGESEGPDQQDAKQPDEDRHENRRTGQERVPRDDLIPQSWMTQ